MAKSKLLDDPKFVEFARRATAPDRLALIADRTRPGISRFFALLEYSHFPPGTKANDDFQLLAMLWPDGMDLLWFVASVPSVKKPEILQVASDTGMRLADGVPTLLSMSRGDALGSLRSRAAEASAADPRLTEVQRFPIDHDTRAWTIENDMNSPVYLPGGEAFIRAEERRWLRAFNKEHNIPNPEGGE